VVEVKAREPFKPMTFSDIGRVYREKLGGPFYPVTPDTKPVERWYCDLSGCTQWRDESGVARGTCSGYCLCY
jgi:hypothetical protein